MWRAIVLLGLVVGCGTAEPGGWATNWPEPVDSSTGGLGGEDYGDPESTGGGLVDDGMGGESPIPDVTGGSDQGVGGHVSTGGALVGVGGSDVATGGVEQGTGGVPAGVGGSMEPTTCQTGKLECDHYHSASWLDVAWVGGETCGEGEMLIPGAAPASPTWDYHPGDVVCFQGTNKRLPPERVFEVKSRFGSSVTGGWCAESSCEHVPTMATGECTTWSWFLAEQEFANPTDYAPQYCP
jgi:hypothetical protein